MIPKKQSPAGERGGAKTKTLPIVAKESPPKACRCPEWQKACTFYLKHRCDLQGNELTHFEMIEGKLKSGEILSPGDSLALAFLAALSSGWDSVEDVYDTFE
jgi:hypothetical protein